MKELHFSLIFLLALAGEAIAQDAVPLSRTNRSIIPAQDQPAVEPGGFKKEDHITGDWGGYRERLFASGVEVFGFYNSIFNGNVSGGTHPRHATYVDDAWLGFKFDLEKLVGWKGGLFRRERDQSERRRSHHQIHRQHFLHAAISRRAAAVSFIRFICSRNSGRAG